MLRLMDAIGASPYNQAVKASGRGKWCKVWLRDSEGDLWQVDITERGKAEPFGDDLGAHDVLDLRGLLRWLYQNQLDPRYGWEPIR